MTALFRPTLFLCLAGQMLLSGVAHGLDWPQWRGPGRTGVSTETNWVSEWGKQRLEVFWRANVGAGFSSVATSEGRVYTMGNIRETDTVYCFAEKTGQLLWRYNYPCSATYLDTYRGPRATPTVDGTRVYTLSRLGHLLCLNANTGALIWTKHLVDDFGGRHTLYGYSGSPLVVGNVLVVETGAEKRSVVGLNKANGRLIWGTGGQTAGYASPVPMQFGANPGVVVFSGQGVVGRNAANGQIVFNQRWTTHNNIHAATPIVWQDKVFISSGYDAGCALLQVGRGGVRPVWSNKYMRNEFSSSVLVGGHVYGFDNRELRCLDLVNGGVKWRTPIYGKGSLTAAGTKLIVQSENGMIAVVEATPWEFKEISKRRIFNSRGTYTVPVLSNGKLFARNQGLLVCINLGASD